VWLVRAADSWELPDAPGALDPPGAVGVGAVVEPGAAVDVAEAGRSVAFCDAGPAEL